MGGSATLSRNVRFASGKPYEISDILLIKLQDVIKPGDAVTEDHLEQIGRLCTSSEEPKAFFIFCALWLKIGYKQCQGIVPCSSAEMMRFVTALFTGAGKVIVQQSAVRNYLP